tara:strand:+ start:249 stop:506 length:258 start_codon:yes stop_codon:yes gene_type:complete
MIEDKEKIIGIAKHEAMIWASGTFLTEHLPDEFEEWEEDDLYAHLVEFAWEPFDYYSGEQILELIDNLAWDFQQKVNQILKEKEK